MAAGLARAGLARRGASAGRGNDAGCYLPPAGRMRKRMQSDHIRDIALVEKDGEIIVHRADCPEVRRLAAQGEPVATLFGCEQPLPPEYKWHSCKWKKP